jgi:hypothetical protein
MASLPFALYYTQESRPAQSWKSLNQSAAALSGSFAPADRFENLEIRKGFLQFPNLNLEQNPSLTTLAIESEVPLHFSARFAIIFPNRAKRESEVIS